MATALRPRTVLLRPASPVQRRQVADALRAIGRLAPRPPRARYACAACSVAWAGPEADCWSCGRPATHARDDHSLLHRLLLAPRHPHDEGGSAVSTMLPADLDRRLAAELVPQRPAPPRNPRRTAAPAAAPAADPHAAEHRDQLLAALRQPTTRTAPSPKETTAA